MYKRNLQKNLIASLPLSMYINVKTSCVLPDSHGVSTLFSDQRFTGTLKPATDF